MLVDLGDAFVGEGRPCYVVAEIGINHNGDVRVAEQLIDAAVEAGANAVKLQKRTVDAVYSAEYLGSPRESPWGTTQRAQKEGLEFSLDEYRHLREYARTRLTITASAWDPQALRDVVETLDPPWLKVASASITDVELVRAYVATGRSLIVSTGMSTLEQVDTVVYDELHERLAQHALLQCTSTYPCDDSEINLRAIETMRERYGVPIGYSGHERGIATSVAAVALGACIVERHLTLDRTMYGSDQAASLEPKGFAQMVRDIRAVEAAMGDGVKRVYASEVPIAAKLRRVR